MSSRAIPITASNLVLSAALAVPVDVNDQDTGDSAAPIATPGRLSLTLGPGRTGVRRSAAVAAHGDEVRAVSRRRHGIPVHLDTHRVQSAPESTGMTSRQVSKRRSPTVNL